MLRQIGFSEIKCPCNGIDFIYYDARKTEISLESYKEVVDRDFLSLLSEEKRSRYIQTRIAAIRMMPKSIMKITHYGPEEKINYNKPATEEIAGYINENLKAKDKIAKKTDGKVD